MGRLTKTLVLASSLVALAAHVGLLSAQYPWLPWVTAAAFGISLALARTSFTLGLAAPLVLAYSAPAVLLLVSGTPEYQLLVVWLALLAGPVVTASDWTGWHMPGRWSLAVVAWALVLAVTWPVIALREVDFSLIAARTFDTPNGLVAPPPPVSAAGVVLTALGQLLGLLWLDLLWTRFSGRRLTQAERAVCLPLVVSAVLACCVGLVQKTVDISWLSIEPWPRLGRASGLMLDANSFGMAAAIWSPLTFAVTWRLGLPAAAGAALTALLAAGVWTSGSRTALLVGLVGLAAVAVATAWHSRAWPRRYAPLVLLVGVAIIAGVASLDGGDPANPVARLVATIPSGAEGGASQLARDLWDRDGYGIAAERAIAEHPWTGVGIGAFTLLSPEYYRLQTGGTIPGDNAQNWWRHQIAELGLLGALPALAFSVSIFLMLFRGAATPEDRGVVTLLKGTLLGVGLASLVGVGTQHPAVFVTFVTMVFWLGSLLVRREPQERPRAAWWGVIVLAAAVTVGQTVSALGTLRVPYRALAHGFPYGYGFSEPQLHPTMGTVRRTAGHAVAVIRAEHAYFHVMLLVPHATTDAPVHVTLWRGAERIVDQRITGQEPLTRYIAVRPRATQLMLELDVSHTADDGTGVVLAGNWLRELPGGTPSHLVVP